MSFNRGLLTEHNYKGPYIPSMTQNSWRALGDSPKLAKLPAPPTKLLYRSKSIVEIQAKVKTSRSHYRLKYKTQSCWPWQVLSNYEEERLLCCILAHRTTECQLAANGVTLELED
jgi:hypothetical protein